MLIYVFRDALWKASPGENGFFGLMALKCVRVSYIERYVGQTFFAEVINGCGMKEGRKREGC